MRKIFAKGNFVRNYLKNLRLTDVPSFLKHPVHDRDRTRLCVFRMQVYIRVGGLPISPVCSWSKAESRFCSPCHSVSTLVKGLLGESNTLRPLRFSSLLCISARRKQLAVFCSFKVVCSRVTSPILLSSEWNATSSSFFFSLSLSVFFFLVRTWCNYSTYSWLDNNCVACFWEIAFFFFPFFLHFRVLELNKYLRVFSV